MLTTEVRNWRDLAKPERRLSPAGPLPIVLLGPPGSGKGTQARLLSASLGFPSISTGELLRHDFSRRLPKDFQAGMRHGLLMPDAIVNAIVAQRLKQPDCAAGFILDGYPRDVNQARHLDAALKLANSQTPLILHLLLPDTLVTQRIVSRLECPLCGRTTSTAEGPRSDTPAMCPHDGSILVRRQDDNTQSLLNRLNAYHQTIPELLRFYSGCHVFDIPASGSSSAIGAQILAIASNPDYRLAI